MEFDVWNLGVLCVTVIVTGRLERSSSCGHDPQDPTSLEGGRKEDSTAPEIRNLGAFESDLVSYEGPCFLPAIRHQPT